MPFEPIDLTALVATVLGISIVLVPVIGLTARFALKPVVEALSKVFEDRSTNEVLSLLERRVELQSQEIDALQLQLSALQEGHDFDRQLGAGPTGTDEAPDA